MPASNPRTDVYQAAAREANKAAVREAAEAIHAETGRAPKVAELMARSGLAMATCIKWRKALIAEGDYPFGVPVRRAAGRHARPRPDKAGSLKAAARRANKAAVLRAARAVHAETRKPPTLAELVGRSGLSMATVTKWRKVLVAENNYPFGVLKDGGYERGPAHRTPPEIRHRFRAFDPSAPDPVLDAIPVERVWERARRIRELNGHAVDPRGALV